MTRRIVEPELLETLAEDDPAALHGRRDLRIVNRVMGTHRWILRTLRRCYQSGWRITELGAGDGALSSRLWRSGLCRTHDIHAFDLADPPPHWPREAEWTKGNLFLHDLPDSQVLVVNLLLHQFHDDQLRLLGTRIPNATRVILAAEPARAILPSLLGRVLCGAARFHDVTRHDMQVSIRAGFQGTELGDALQLTDDWKVQTGTSLRGAYQFWAQRPATPPSLRPTGE